jgi:methylated-DNA-[protein]-cysteine S-methyltransferase
LYSMIHTTPLALSCYKLMREIPLWKITTYKILAEKLWTWPRVIGRICGANQDIPATPCHRVIRSDGKVDGYVYGTDRKIELLTSEWIIIDNNNKVVDLSKYIYHF